MMLALSNDRGGSLEDSQCGGRVDLGFLVVADDVGCTLEYLQQNKNDVSGDANLLRH